MLTRSLQPENAVPLIEVTLAGSVTLARLSQPWNALSAKVVSPVQFSSESDTLLLALFIPCITDEKEFVSAASMTVFCGSSPIISATHVDDTLPEKVTDSRFVQPEKMSLPTDVTFSGMTMFVRPVHPSKALSPMDVTDEGMDTLVFPSGQQMSVVPLLPRSVPSSDE
jgi:hypothetical protein